jgi:tRNA A37 threonylcarbamoyladenosine modification protein TsaB
VLKVDLVVIAIESPLLIGVYVDEAIFQTIEVDGQTSEVLPIQFEKLMREYHINRVLFANGPGSFMAIKISYIFLKTLATTTGIELFGADGFYFNGNRPIKAMNSMCFVKSGEDIKIERVEDFEKSSFQLPERFRVEEYSKDIEPLYILPAI